MGSVAGTGAGYGEKRECVGRAFYGYGVAHCWSWSKEGPKSQPHVHPQLIALKVSKCLQKINSRDLKIINFFPNGLNHGYRPK
jgi:hypothetical protein